MLSYTISVPGWFIAQTNVPTPVVSLIRTRGIAATASAGSPACPLPYNPEMGAEAASDGIVVNQNALASRAQPAKSRDIVWGPPGIVGYSRTKDPARRL